MATTSLTFIQVLIVLSLLQTFTAFTWNTKHILNRRRCLCRNVPNVPLQAEWERFEGCDICFPDDPDLDPKAIVHFIGGTGLGVFPRQSYASLLEGIVDEGDIVVVATPLPVMLLSPLDHIEMLYQICDQFQNVYHDVIENEFGVDIAKDLPIIGIGHSLGSRLHVILNSYSNEEDGENDLLDIAYPREGNILMGFNNYSSKRSIPLLNEMSGIVDTLTKSNNGLLPKAVSQISNVVEDAINNIRSDLEVEAEYDSDADFLLRGIDFIQDIPGRIMGKTQEVSMSAEFIPSPVELWKDIEEGHYMVEKTLFVQMKNDKLDQNAKLATLIQAAMPRSNKLKYALLPGGHLTPADNSESNMENCDDLVSSIVSYIEDIILVKSEAPELLVK